MSTNQHTALIVALVATGMVVPLIGVLLFHDVVSLYLTRSEFTYVVAAAFCLLAWTFVASLDVDRLNVVLVALVFPWIIVFGTAMIALLFGLFEDLEYLFRGVEDIGRYAAVYTMAGIGAVALQHVSEQVSDTARSVPSPRSLAFGATAVVAVAVLVGVASLHVAASSVAVSAVEPGEDRFGDPALNVTLDGEPAELRLRVTSPAGATHVKRVSPGDFQSDATTVPVEWYHLDRYPAAGNYHVRVAAISGFVVDSATYTIERAPSPALVRVETAGPGEPLELRLPTGVPEHRPSPGLSDPETRVGVVIENEGDVAVRFDVGLLDGEEYVTGREIKVDPRQRAGTVVALSEDEVERVRERSSGSLTVAVRYRDEVVTRNVTLPG